LGAAQVIRERTKNPIHLPWEKVEFDRAMGQLEDMLGSAGRGDAIGQGRRMSLDEAVAFARDGST
jgi:hypothetical protein